MPAPQGELLTVVINGQEQTVTIEPTLFSRRSLDALCRIYRHNMRQNIWDDMASLANAPMPVETKAEIRSEYTTMLKKATMPGMQEALEALQSPDGLIAALEVNSSLTREDATKAVNETPNLSEIFKTMLTVLTEESESAKN